MRTVQTEIARPDARPNLPDPAQLQLRSLDWTVVTPDNLPKGNGWALFALTPRGYEDLSLNNAEVLRWVTEAAWRLKYYKGELDVDAEPEGAEVEADE